MFLSNKKEPGYSFYVLLPINDHFLFLATCKQVFLNTAWNVRVVKPNVSPCITMAVALPLRALPNVSANNLLDHDQFNKRTFLTSFSISILVELVLDEITSADSIPTGNFP